MNWAKPTALNFTTRVGCDSKHTSNENCHSRLGFVGLTGTWQKIGPERTWRSHHGFAETREHAESRPDRLRRPSAQSPERPRA